MNKIKRTGLVMALFMVAMGIVGARATLDLRYYYTREAADFFLQSLTTDEVAAYIRNQWLDFGFLCSYSTLFFFLAEKFYPQNRRLVWSSLVPGAFDFVENCVMLFLLYDLSTRTAPWWLGWVTCLKWTTGAIYVAVLLWGRIRMARQSQ